MEKLPKIGLPVIVILGAISILISKSASDYRIQEKAESYLNALEMES